MSKAPFRFIAGVLMAAAGTGAADAYAGTTQIRSYSPPIGASEITYKTAATCHDNVRDVYGVATVFHVRDLSTGLQNDRLYYLRVDGNSASPTYGNLLDAMLLDTESQIDTVDCASDDANKIYVVFDRFDNDAAWLRIDATTVAGPYPVTATTGFCQSGVRTHKPRIAYGGGQVMVAYEGWHYDIGARGCEVCEHQFNALSGAPIPGTEVYQWLGGSQHSDYDVEWNGADRFVVAVPQMHDMGGGGEFDTFTYTPAGSTSEVKHLLQTFPSGVLLPPDKTRLVYSNNTHNNNHRMYIQTEVSNFWIYTDGALVPGGARTDAAGSKFALCEYWGADSAVSALFTPYTTTAWVPGFPSGHYLTIYNTMRWHFGLSPAAPYESFLVNTNYFPEACDGGNTYTDTEVMVVSSPFSGPNANVYWNLLSND